MKVTIAEIAAAAGVSPATVSRVMTGSEEVSPEKREAVQQALARTPGALARPRRRRDARNVIIGILQQTLSPTDARGLLGKLHLILEALPPHWKLVHLPDTTGFFELDAAWRRREFNGLLLCGHRCREPEMKALLRGIPHVWLNSHDGESLWGNEIAGKLAAESLLKQGVRAPLAIDVATLNPGIAARISGFDFEYYSRFGVRPERRRLEAEFETASDAELEAEFDRVLPAGELGKFTGLFIPEARLTALFYRHCVRRRLEWNAPVVSCGRGEEYFAALWPRPATVDLRSDILVRLAVDELRARLAGELPASGGAGGIMVNPQLIPGETV